MKHLAGFLLVLLSATSLFNVAHAQTPVIVCHVELSDSFTHRGGKVVRVGNTLVFVDDADVRASFAIDHANIKNHHEQAGVFSIYTGRPVMYRARDRMHFEFRWGAGNCESIAQWLRSRGRNREAARGVNRAAAVRKYPVIHRRRWATDFSGVLTISEKKIEFECPANDCRPIRWGLRDIRDIRQQSPFELLIFPYNDDKYTFEFQSQPLERAVFNALVSRVIMARQPASN
jgi:hypothetical protein